MKLLLGRELRRQGCYALGPCAILAASLIAQPLLDAGATRSASSGPHLGASPLLAPELWLLLLAGVLGVAAVAPDRGSGGQAFLRRLPLSLRRAFALRLAAGALWLGLGLALALGGLALRSEAVGLSPGLVLGWPLAYAAGLAASTVTQRPLAAIGLAIPLGFLAALTFFAPLLATGLRPPSASAMILLLTIPTGVTVGAAYVAYRHGRIHLDGLRPFGLSLVTLLGLSLLGSGGTALARSAHQSLVLESLQPLAASGRGAGALLTLTGAYWYGFEQRVLVLRAGQAPRVLARRGARSPQLSPDGRQVLVRGDTITAHGALCDLESGEVRELDLGFSDARDVLWGPKGPLLASLATAFSLRLEAAITPGASRRVLLLATDEVRSLSSDDLGRVYLVSATGLRRIAGLAELELPQVQEGEKVRPTPLGELGLVAEELPFPSELAGRVRGLRVSPEGRLAVLLLSEGRVGVLELGSGRFRELPRSPQPQVVERLDEPFALEGRIHARDLAAFVDPRQVMGSYRLAFAPEGQGVVLEGTSGWTVWCDLEGDRVRTFLEPEPGSGLPSWASDGQAILLSSGRVWESGSEAPRELNPTLRPLCWQGAESVLAAPRAAPQAAPTQPAGDLRSLVVLDLSTGRSERLGGVR